MGYVLNDNSASGGVKFETDTCSCSHCQKAMHVAKWKEHGGWCHRCAHAICWTCCERMLTYGCEPFKRKIDEAWETAMRLQRLGIPT